MATLHSSTSSSASKYEHELKIARLAVQRASILTRRVFHEKAKGTVDKNDKSPVTIGDFGAQALITAALRHHFPSDAIVAEEEAAGLRQNAALRDAVWSVVRDTRHPDDDAEDLLGGAVASADDMLELIDRGAASQGGGHGRTWTIDPIDGTKGFLRGGQYAVCLALMVDGDVAVGVLGCPNLPVDDAARLTAGMGENQTDDEDLGRGVLFSAVLHHGATSQPLSPTSSSSSSSTSTSISISVSTSTSTSTSASSNNNNHPRPISMRPITDLTTATFCESVEAGHSSHGDQAAIATALGISSPSVRMDSQAKYGSIARGAGDIYLRLPTSAAYREKIWDHAAGDLIVREAGGSVTDVRGRRLDFSRGRTLEANKGVVAAPRGVHATVLAAVQKVLNVGSEE